MLSEKAEKKPILLTHTVKVPKLRPIMMVWLPQPDITVEELAKCLPYLITRTSEVEIDTTTPYLRHFQIINPNKN